MFGMKSVIKTEEVEFLCYERDYEVIPRPIPARKILPQWFKDLPPKIDNQNKLENSTIKRCAPFLDAMTMGWIIPLVADVEIVSNDDASGFNYKCLFDQPVIEAHGMKQVEGNPQSPKPPMKFLNYWAIKMPPGYSMLFVPPLNRPDMRFQCIAGMVDDGYMGNDNLEFINFPFFFTQPNYTGILKAGTPLVQAIPIKRDDISMNTQICNVNKLSTEDLALIDRTRRRRKSHESMYRDSLWQRK